MDELERSVEEYWTKRAADFLAVRLNELKDPISDRWLEEMGKYLPEGRPLRILDVGTGTGYFAILLARKGHTLTGIDLTPAMVAEAEQTAAGLGLGIDFRRMDAQATDFPDGSFDVLVTRNLSWTLPDPEKAYREWHRLLKPGGLLLNFDADYARNVRNENQRASYISREGVYGHVGITPALSAENARITLAMPASRHSRPAWDLELLDAAGFSEFGADETAGARILRERDLADAPLFLLWARK
ncbi:MAG: class I SAM-dependent methyltransferase [Oscillospiraceae bacterium]|nr:class I SAM-dependent methyltransferase [Oscillospiraceae bacterium]